MPIKMYLCDVLPEVPQEDLLRRPIIEDVLRSLGGSYATANIISEKDYCLVSVDAADVIHDDLSLHPRVAPLETAPSLKVRAILDERGGRNVKMNALDIAQSIHPEIREIVLPKVSRR